MGGKIHDLMPERKFLVNSKGLTLYSLIYQHQTVDILSLCFLPQGLNKETIIPCCLIYINATSLHGRSGSIPKYTRISLKFGAFLTESAGSS